MTTYIYENKPLKRPKKAVFGQIILLFSTFSHLSFTKFYSLEGDKSQGKKLPMNTALSASNVKKQ